MSHLVAFLLALPPVAVLTAALVLPALEASALIGLVVPGESAVFVAGLTAHAGRLPLWGVIVAASLGAAVGDQIGFRLGRRWGAGLLNRLPHRLRRGDRVERITDLIARRGGWAVVAGRWTALLRALVPSLAGAGSLAPRTFLIANVLGGVTWAGTIALLGFGAGAAYTQVLSSIDHLSWIVLGLLAVVAVVAAIRRRRLGPGPR